MTYRWLRSTLFGGLGLALSVVGCSGDDDDSNPYASGLCDLYGSCCARAGKTKDTTLCQMAFSSAPTNKAAAEQCLADMKELAKSPEFCDFEDAEPESCKQAFANPGTKDPGQACTDDDECGDGATCDTDFDTKQGVCVKYVIVPEGAACIGEQRGNMKSWSRDPVNNQILLCDFDAGMTCDSGVCEKRSEVGGPCSWIDDCVDGAYCLDQKCASQLATGAPCSGSVEDECNTGAYCEASTKKCEPRRPDNEACTDDQQCSSDFCEEGVCKYSPGLGGLVLLLVCSG